MSNLTLNKIKEIQKELNDLGLKKDLLQAQRVILSVIRLLDESVSVDDQSQFQLFTDSDGKIKANSSWFYEDSVMTDRKATYKIHPNNSLNIDFKLFGITKPSKRTIAWAQALTPNFEDEPFNTNFKVGIDFVVPKSADKVIIILSNNWIVRTLELKGELTVTYQEILAKWAEIQNFENKKELHNILWESFDIQPLNKKFYLGISERFTTLRQHLVENDILDEKHASLFANRLIGRVIFCWFLDKKGIINKDLKYFDSESFDDDTKYYKVKLEKLFFGVLNTPIEDRDKISEGQESLFGEKRNPTLFTADDTTPFLNGGLFEARQNDLYKNPKLTFPKDYFDDLFEFLSSYNFTTDESTSQFQQVAIDPEMLGRIFENLLAEMTEETGEQARKAKGAFYTPREIVDYMCKESLKEYLKTKLEEDENRDQRLYQLIDAPDKDFQDQDHNWRRDWKPYKETIINALDDLKVLDPACGSGAFPIGMLQLLVQVYERLEARFDPFKTKMGIIEKNIYGVDIEPMAVEIARLRTWLSIIVDEESDSKKIKPLPNLEFKFICANSLIDLERNGTAAFGEDPELENNLREIRDAYFNTGSIKKKKKLHKEYNSLVNKQQGLFGESKKAKQLKTYRPFDNESSADFFNPFFMFGVELFHILIANPPYLKERGNKEKFRKVHESSLGKKFKSGKMDFWYYFLHKGVDLVEEQGIISFITPSYWTQGSGSKKLVNHIKESLIFKQVVNIGKLKVFDEVVGHHMIAIYQKASDKNGNFVYKKLISSLEGISSEKSTTSVSVDQKAISSVFKNGEILFELDGQSDFPKLPTLGDKYRVSQGVVEATDRIPTKKRTGSENVIGVFVLNSEEIEKIKATKPEKAILKRYLSSKDINKYSITFNDTYLIYSDRSVKEQIRSGRYPNIKNHLDHQKKFITSSNSPYGLHRPRDKKFFDERKIIFKGMFKSPDFVIDDQGYYFGMSMLSVIQQNHDYSLELLLGILNSNFAEKWFNRFGKKRGVGVDIGVNKLRAFPLPDLQDKKTKGITRQIEKKVLEIQKLTETEKKIEIVQAEIDELVTYLYKP